MTAALFFLGGCVLVAAVFIVRDWLKQKSRERIEAATAHFEAAKAKRDAEIDADKTPKPRTEQEIRDDLKNRHPSQHRIVR